MENLVNIFVKSIFIDNMIFAYFLGMCSYLAVSKTVKTSTGLGIAVIFVLGFTVPIDFLLEKFVLKAGALQWISPGLADVDLSFLSFIMFIAVIASMVQLVEMVIQKVSPVLYQSLGIFLPLITTNCAILGLAIFQTNRGYGFFEGLFFAIGAGLGLTLALVLMASIREDVEVADVPRLVRGTALVLIIAGSLSLAFMGFAGLGG